MTEASRVQNMLNEQNSEIIFLKSQVMRQIVDIVGYRDRIEKLETARNGAYTERNRLVAFLASIYPSGVKKTAIPGWDEAWHNCVYIDLPVGQASWHYHDSEAHLFAHLPAYSSEWDGHTTEEKYERLFLASSHAKQTDELLADYIKFADELVPHTKKQADRIEKLEAALRSIAANGCCDSCREAALVARKALGEKECETCSHYSFKVWGIDRSISGKCFGWGEKSKYVNSDDTCERWSMEKKHD